LRFTRIKKFQFVVYNKLPSGLHKRVIDWSLRSRLSVHLGKFYIAVNKKTKKNFFYQFSQQYTNGKIASQSLTSVLSFEECYWFIKISIIIILKNISLRKIKQNPNFFFRKFCICLLKSLLEVVFTQFLTFSEDLCLISFLLDWWFTKCYSTFIRSYLYYHTSVWMIQLIGRVILKPICYVFLIGVYQHCHRYNSIITSLKLNSPYDNISIFSELFSQSTRCGSVCRFFFCWLWSPPVRLKSSRFTKKTGQTFSRENGWLSCKFLIWTLQVSAFVGYDRYLKIISTT